MSSTIKHKLSFPELRRERENRKDNKTNAFGDHNKLTVVDDGELVPLNNVSFRMLNHWFLLSFHALST